MQTSYLQGKWQGASPLEAVLSSAAPSPREKKIYEKLAECGLGDYNLPGETIAIIACVLILLERNHLFNEIKPVVLWELLPRMGFTRVRFNDVLSVMEELEMSSLAVKLMCGERPDLQRACELFLQQQ